MHIYFIGIGGTGIGPLALIASEAGYSVSGSDQKESEYTRYLRKKELSIYIDQSGASIRDEHAQNPIDWVVAVSSITRNNPDHPELVFARENGIKITERDACLNEILEKKNLKMIAAAGTHGKTTTTAMFVWAMQELGIPISYSVGAKMSFADMGHYEAGSEYFVYECDEFHRNFLHFRPHMAVITGVTWDHHEVFPTREDYKSAFREFIDQCETSVVWQREATYLAINESDNIIVLENSDPRVHETQIAGAYNRENAWLVIEALYRLTGINRERIQEVVAAFPGAQRRMEEVAENIFSDYAHTPEKINGCLSVAREIAQKRGKDIVVVYEPLTNRRQHYMKDEYGGVFNDVRRVYWVPSYLSREDPTQEILTPEYLISRLENPSIAQASPMDDELWQTIRAEIENNALVICMSGGGGGSLDEWLRAKVREQNL